jgi:serine/threonine-protein kinase
MSVVDAGIQGVEFFSVANGRATRLPGSASEHGMALWTPDSRFVVMDSPTGLSWARADGGTPQPLLQSPTIQIPWTLTPNGDRLAYHEVNASSAFDLWTVPIHRDERGLHAGTPELYLRTASYEVYPSFSPDGRWLAYGSNESGTWEVYVRRFPDDGTKIQVSVNGGRIPRWSLDGRDLFYRTDGQRLMVVRYTARSGSFVPDAPRPWGPARLADTGVLPNFDLAPDGRIVALIPAGAPVLPQQDNHVTLLTGFFGELARRASLAGWR